MVALLRDIPRDTSLATIVSAKQEIYDKISFSNTHRKLTGNEVSVMVLNEIAREHGRGYFFFLPAREAWKTNPEAARHPKSRWPQLPGAQYPTILYMDFTWDDALSKSFDDDTHRARYLKCNALINPPSSVTPLYAVQFVDSSRSALYRTPKDTLMIIHADSQYYVLSTSQALQIIGSWSGRNPPAGPDPGLRLSTIPGLWDVSKKSNGGVMEDKLRSHMLTDLNAVYEEIRRQCSTDGALQSSFTAAELMDVIPRPLQPEAGVALGNPIIAGESSEDPTADPPSRRTVKKPRARPSTKTGQ